MPFLKDGSDALGYRDYIIQEALSVSQLPSCFLQNDLIPDSSGFRGLGLRFGCTLRQ